jgi:ParB-like chromosome segregation protein Spo0J
VVVGRQAAQKKRQDHPVGYRFGDPVERGASTSKKRRPVSKHDIGPVVGTTTVEAIEAELAAHAHIARPENWPKKLSMGQIAVAAEGVFQWRRRKFSRLASQSHVVALASALRIREESFAPLHVFPTGKQFYVMDGHHRLAAYRAAGWKASIPVRVFTGSLQEAREAALADNVRDKLPMTPLEKQEAAWSLVKMEAYTKAREAQLSGASRSNVQIMRKKWHQVIKPAIAIVESDAQQELRNMLWLDARNWTPGTELGVYEDRSEQAAQALVDKLKKHGLAEAFIKKPSVTALALLLLNPSLPVSLLSEWWNDQSIQERMLEWIEIVRREDGGFINVDGAVEDGGDVIEF